MLLRNDHQFVDGAGRVDDSMAGPGFDIVTEYGCVQTNDTGLYAQIHENFRVPGFLSVPASFDRLGAACRQGQDAGKGSGG